MITPRKFDGFLVAIFNLASKFANWDPISSNRSGFNLLAQLFFSNDEGKVNISWKTDGSGERSSFHFNWVEKGGPRVVEPEQSKRGFGTRLIERMLKNDFGGEVVLDFEPDGLVCALSAPLEKLTTPEYQDV